MNSPCSTSSGSTLTGSYTNAGQSVASTRTWPFAQKPWMRYLCIYASKLEGKWTYYTTKITLREYEASCSWMFDAMKWLGVFLQDRCCRQNWPNQCYRHTITLLLTYESCMRGIGEQTNRMMKYVPFREPRHIWFYLSTQATATIWQVRSKYWDTEGYHL